MSLCTLLDAAVAWRDPAFASEVFYKWGTEQAHSPRARQSFLRSFRTPSQAAGLTRLTSSVLSQNSSDVRTLDELVNAHLRVRGVGYTLHALLPMLRRRGRLRLSSAALTNILICLERFWRDWTSFESEQSVSEDTSVATQLLAQQLQRSAGSAREPLLWGALVGMTLSRGDYDDAIQVLRSMGSARFSNRHRYRAAEQAQALELGVYCALEGGLLLLQEGSLASLSQVRRGCALSVILQSAARLPGLSGGHPRRVTCTVDNVLDFLTRYVASGAEESASRVPVGVHLLQSLFEETVLHKQYSRAADVVRLLERSRLVLDLEADEVRSALHLGRGEPFNLSIAFVREQLARMWAAKLLGSSINVYQAEVADSLRRAILSARSKSAESEAAGLK